MNRHLLAIMCSMYMCHAIVVAAPATTLVRSEITVQPEMRSKMGLHNDVPENFIFVAGSTPATSQSEQLNQLQQLVSAQTTGDRASSLNSLDQSIVIAFNPDSDIAVSEAVAMMQSLPPGWKPIPIAVSSDQFDMVAGTMDKPAPDVAMPGKSLLARFGLPPSSAPTEVERSTAWFMASFRTLTLLPMIVIGLQSPMAISSIAGFAIAALMVGRTFWRANYIEFFDALYTGSRNGVRGHSRIYERVLRYSADLLFFEALGFLTSVNTGTPMMQTKILALFAIQSSLGNLFQVARSSTYAKTSGGDAETVRLTRQRSAMANLNNWMLIAPFPVLDLFGLTPKLFSILSIDITGAHLGLAVASIFSALAIRTAWYNNFLSVQQKWGHSGSQLTKQGINFLLRIPRTLCAVTTSFTKPNGGSDGEAAEIVQMPE